MATKKVMKSLLRKLTHLQKRVEVGDINYTVGICSNAKIGYLYDAFDELSLFQEISEKWKYYSGASAYPVSCSEKKSVFAQYRDAKDKWTGKYGKRRRELLLFVINELEQQLKTKPRRKK